MTKRLQTYETPDITVTFDPNVCKHTGVCLITLPRVFDVRRSRWVQPEAADANAVAAAVQKCPSGALQFYRNVARDPVAASLLARRMLMNKVAVIVDGSETRVDAAASGQTVIANDVSADPRYLTTSAGTRAEMIVPVIEPSTREVLGTIDVASNRVDAFGNEDRDLVEDCARAMLGLWTEPS